MRMKSRRPTGLGKSVDTPPKDRERNLSGADQLDELPSGPKAGGITPASFDGDFAGNVVGCCSKPVSMK